jgi:hypothetical protein
MRAGVIHDNYRIPLREWIHIVQKGADEFRKLFSCPGSREDVEMQDAIQGYGGKNAITKAEDCLASHNIVE